MSSVKDRLTAALAASAVLMGSVAAFGGSPASAAPGDASALGVGTSLTVNLLGQPAIGLSATLGSVAAPPDATESLVDAAIGVPATAAVTAGVINTEATSSASAATGEAEVTGATVSVPAIDLLIGGPILGTGTSVIRASADCATGSDPVASFGDTATLEVAGNPVTLDVNGEALVDVQAGVLGSVGTVFIQTDSSTVSTDTAEAIALVVAVDINVVGVASVVGEVQIAAASCERPAADESPSIVSIDPNSGPVAGGQTVTITGTNFVDGDTQVIVDGVAVPDADVTVVSPTELTYTTPAHAEGPVDVYVITPVSSTTTLEYTYVDDGTDAPTISGIDPDEGPVAGGTVVVLTGTDFIDGDTTVTIDGIVIPVGEVTVNGGGATATFTTPAHAEGPVDVTATTSNGTSGPQTFTYVDDGTDAPTLTGIDPDEGPVAGGTVVVLTGGDFVPGETTITIGGVEIPAGDVEVDSDGVTATFTTPPHAEGPVDVTATTGGGTSGPQTFTYIGDETGPEAPVAETIDPAEGPVTGGTVVVIGGSGFVPGETTVIIDGQTIPANEVTVNDEGTTVTFTTPPHVVGPVDVIVNTPNGSSGVLVYTYIDGGTPPTTPPTTPGTTPPNGGPMYANCDAVYAAGLANLTPSDPGYDIDLDSDGDGVACEQSGNGGPGGSNGSGNNGNNGNSSNGGGLPATGSDSVPLVAGGLLTVLVGGAVLAARRRLA